MPSLSHGISLVTREHPRLQSFFKVWEDACAYEKEEIVTLNRIGDLFISDARI